MIIVVASFIAKQGKEHETEDTFRWIIPLDDAEDRLYCF